MTTPAMARSFALGLLSLLAACIPEYHPPTLAEPHATVKIRRSYDTIAGTALREMLLVDGHHAYVSQVPAALAREARIDSTLVHPIPATFHMASGFYHHELRQVQEQYYEQQMYTDFESYDCSSGYGTSAIHRTCSRTVTRYRPVTRYRWVTKMVEVLDAQCEAQSRLAPAPGRVYLLQYNFQEHDVCSLSCFEQVPNSDGSFQNLACPLAPPAAN